MKVRIDHLLTWAFVHELAKGGGVTGVHGPGSAWARIAGMAKLGAMVDRGRGDPESFILEQSPPDPDAVIIGEAVNGLAAVPWWLPAARSLMACFPREVQVAHAALAQQAADLAMAGFDAARATGQLGAMVVNLVVRHAILGRKPDSPSARDLPKVEFERLNGGFVWYVDDVVTGALGNQHRVPRYAPLDPKTGRRPASAYRNMVFERDPMPVLVDIVERFLWEQAMEHLVAVLDGRLARHQAVHLWAAFGGGVKESA